MNQTGYPRAVAAVCGDGDHPNIRGTVKFFQRSDGVLVEAAVSGLPRGSNGFFAFHIHDGGNCLGEGFPYSGGHFNPGSREHPSHAGDLPPLLSDFGKAYMKVLTGRFRVEEVIGKTVIVHGSPDDFQPSGNLGKRIACGVIQRV